MAFRMTARRLALERTDVAPALKKMWKYHQHVDGQVTRHLSPYELNAVGSFFSAMPKKLAKRFMDHGLPVAMCVGIVIGTTSWADHEYHEIARRHRD